MANANSTLKLCYVDISTATSAGRTSVRILPSEGPGVFFSNAVKRVNSKRGEIEQIIKEAICAEDRVRVIVSREDEFDCKSIREYVKSEMSPQEIYREILVVIKDLSYEIMFYDAMENKDIVKEAVKCQSRKKNSKLKDFSNHLMKMGIFSRFNSSFWRLEINYYDKLYFLTNDKWDNTAWSELKLDSPDSIFPNWFDEMHRMLIMEAGTNRFNNICLKDEPSFFCKTPAVQLKENTLHHGNYKALVKHAEELYSKGYFEINDSNSALYTLTTRGRKLYDKMWLNNYPGI